MAYIKLVDELLVFCPNRDLGCSITTQRQLLESHVVESCLFTEVKCEDGLCEKNFLRINAKHGSHGVERTLASEACESSGSESGQNVSLFLSIFLCAVNNLMNSRTPQLPHALHVCQS